jgi:hypothetical protein
MSNTGYHQNGQPNWWARVGSGADARFLEIPRTRGDSRLCVMVDVPPGTVVHIGAGKGTYKTIRETVRTEPAVDDAPKDVAPNPGLAQMPASRQA